MLSLFPIPRNKNDPPDHPILSSLSILFCYHQGTVGKGSFLITVVRIPRTILMYMCTTLKGKVRQHLIHGAFGVRAAKRLITGKLQQVPGQECGPGTVAIQKAPGFRSHPPPPPLQQAFLVLVCFIYGFVFWGFSCKTWWR